jgi:HNH endonuclease
MPDIDPTLRALVRSRANGFCEYCHIAERFTLAEHEIDHVIALKHGGQTTAENLALCCSICNRFKGSDIASIDLETGNLTPLFNPRRDRREDHLELRGAEILGLTPTGRATVRLLRMNRPARIKERQLAQG